MRESRACNSGLAKSLDISKNIVVVVFYKERNRGMPLRSVEGGGHHNSKGTLYEHKLLLNNTEIVDVYQN